MVSSSRLFCLAGLEDTPYSIDVYENFLYVTTYRNHSLLSLNKLGPTPNNASDMVVLATGLQRMGDVVVVQQFKQDTSGLNREISSVQLSF